MFIKCGFTLVVLFVFLCECNSQLNVDIINGELYDILKYDAINNEFNIKKNQFNYSINDGFIIDFGKMKVPTQFSFSYLIDNYNESQYFEGCDIRLTSITKDELKNNNYKTGIENDVIFFRIRHPDKINFNDLPIYIDHNNSNFNMNGIYNDIDIYLNWEKKKAHMFLNNRGRWNVASSNHTDAVPNKITADFYHENIRNASKVSKVLIYNFSPKSQCKIKNVKLCNDFCSTVYRKTYFSYMSSKYIKNKIYKILLIFIIL